MTVLIHHPRMVSGRVKLSWRMPSKSILVEDISLEANRTDFATWLPCGTEQDVNKSAGVK